MSDTFLDKYTIGGRLGVFDAAQKMLGFSKGGIVPGKKGRAVVIKAHAGEVVVPSAKVSAINKHLSDHKIGYSSKRGK